MTALFYGTLASEGKIWAPVVNLKNKSKIDKESVKNSIILTYELSLVALEELLSHPPTGLIVERLKSDSKWQQTLTKTPFPTIAGIRNITNYFNTGDIIILDCKNIVVIGKMIDKKFNW